jgi:molecular chaperone HtpG
MYDRLDEWMVGSLSEYSGKKLRSVAKGDLDLGKLADSADQAKREEAEKAAEPVVKKLKELLGDRVSEVRVSKRLTDSPSCLVLDEHEMAVHMQKLLKQAGHNVPSSKPVLEINPEHPLIKRLEGDADSARAADLGLLLFVQAQLAEGGSLEDPAAYVRRVNALLVGG